MVIFYILSIRKIVRYISVGKVINNSLVLSLTTVFGLVSLLVANDGGFVNAQAANSVGCGTATPSIDIYNDLYTSHAADFYSSSPHYSYTDQNLRGGLRPTQQAYDNKFHQHEFPLTDSAGNTITLQPGSYSVRTIATDNHWYHRPPAGSVDDTNPVNALQTNERYYVQLDPNDVTSLAPNATIDRNTTPADHINDANTNDLNDNWDFMGEQRYKTKYVYNPADADYTVRGWYPENIPDGIEADNGMNLGVATLSSPVSSILLRHYYDVLGTYLTNGGNSINFYKIMLECDGGESYSLDASVTPIGSTTVSPGDVVTFRYEVCTNTGDTQATNVSVTIDGVTGPGGVNHQWPVSGPYTIPADGSCLGDGAGNSFYEDTFTIPGNAPAGREYCSSIEAVGSESTSTDGPVCFTVSTGVDMTFNIFGSGVTSGVHFADSSLPDPCSGVGASSSAGVAGIVDAVSNNGSRSEYMVRAPGDIVQFGSLNNPTGASWTFANDSVPYGNYSTQDECQPDNNLYDILDKSASGSLNLPSASINNANANSLLDGNQYFYSGNVTYSGGLNEITKSIVIIIDGNLTITEDITYNVSYSSIDDIPFVAFIVRGNIFISPGVDQLDGLYVAMPDGASDGYIYTCGASVQTGSNTSPSACGDKLVVNGAMVAQNIDLRRTSGGIQLQSSPGSCGPDLSSYEAHNLSSNNAARCSSELFNFSPELYLAGYSLNTGEEYQLDPIQYRELPPIINQ